MAYNSEIYAIRIFIYYVVLFIKINMLKIITILIPFFLQSQGFINLKHKSLCDSLINIHKLDSSFVYKTIHRESKFNPNAVNQKSGAYGYTQVIPETWQKMGKMCGVYHKTPENSLILGIFVIKWLKNYYEQRGYSGSVLYEKINKAYLIGYNKVK